MVIACEVEVFVNIRCLRIIYLVNAVNGQLVFYGFQHNETSQLQKRLDVGHGWCGYAAQVCSTMFVLAVDAFP